MKFPGAGYKTAGWVVCKVYDSDELATLDIHLICAGRFCGIYTTADRVEKYYRAMKDRFLQFASALHIRPAALDYLIWDGIWDAGDLFLKHLAVSEQEHSLATTVQH